MNGYTSKYLFYESNKQSSITIPVGIARSLNWNHKDEINIVFDVINEYKGIFLYKKEQITDFRSNFSPKLRSNLFNYEDFDENEKKIIGILKNNKENGLTLDQIYNSFKLQRSSLSSKNSLDNFSLESVRSLLNEMTKEHKIITHQGKEGNVLYYMNIF